MYTTLSVVLLFPVFYVLIVDPNVSEFLYLKLVRETGLNLQRFYWKYKLLAGLKVETFMMKRGYVPRKYRKMAREVLGRE